MSGLIPTLGQRVRDLTTKLDQLTTRRDELTNLIQAPSPQAITALRDHLRRGRVRTTV